MPHGKLETVAELQIRDTQIRIVALDRMHIGASDKAFAASDRQLSLKGKGGIASIVGSRHALVDEKHGYTLALLIIRFHIASRVKPATGHTDLQAIAARNGFVDTPAIFALNRND